MTDLTQALAEISEIRAQVARGTQFRGYGPASIAVSGTLALIVAAAQAVWMKEGGRDVMPFLAVWVATAAVSVALTTFETVVRSRRVHSGFATEMIQAAVERMLRWYLRCVVIAREVLAPGLGGIDLDSPEAGQQWTGQEIGRQAGQPTSQEAGQEIRQRTGPAPAPVPTPAALRTYDGAVDWASERIPTLAELVSLAADRGFDHLAAQLATALGALCHCVSRWTDWLRVTEIGQAAAQRTNDRLSQGRLRNDAGIAHYFLGRTDEAVACHRAAVELLTGLGELGQPQDQAAAANLAVAYSMMGRHLAAIPMLEEALRIARREGNGFLEASVATNLGVVLSGLDRHSEAIEYGLRCVGLLPATGAKHMLGHALNQLGSSCLHAGRVDEAIDHFGAALDVWRGLGDQWGQANGMCSLARACSGFPSASRRLARTLAALSGSSKSK